LNKPNGINNINRLLSGYNLPGIQIVTQFSLLIHIQWQFTFTV